ncbi:MAG TPA: site-2 protease family protein [Candidatus Brocadiia bacterium]|nr:site-2 protease family protein [Candidatus Brocadiia bacterium]
MLGKTISLGRILGIPVRVDWSWFVIFVFLSWTMASNIFPMLMPNYPATVYWIMGPCSALLLFLSVLLHELGHSIVAMRTGTGVHGITLFIFGGVAEMSNEPPSGVAELVMALAGPATSVAIACGSFGLGWALGRFAESRGAEAALRPFGAVLYYLAQANGMLAIFNLLPGFPLDGGRVFRAMLWYRYGDLRRATSIASRVGKLLGALLIACGVLMVILGQMSGIMFILIGLFLRNAASSSYQHVLLMSSLKGIPVNSVARRSVIAIPPDMTLQTAVDECILRHYPDALIVSDAGKALGLLTPARIGKVPRDRWTSTWAVHAADSTGMQSPARPDEDAYDALMRMSRMNAAELPIIDAAGRFFGIVTRADLMNMHRVRGELER